MPLALSFIGGTQRHERRLAFTLSETIVMTRLASGPRQSVEALSFLGSRSDDAPLPAALVSRGIGGLLCRARSQRLAARVCLFRGSARAKIGGQAAQQG
jgi:hypothetical protein